MSQHLPVIKGDEAIKAFACAGWVLLAKRGKGSHRVLQHPTKSGILTIPDHDPVRRGTLRALIRQAEMTVDEFRNLL